MKPSATRVISKAFSFSRNATQGGKPATRVVAGEIAPNGSFVYGLFDDVDIRSEARHDELSTKFTSYALSATHELSPRWTLSELAGYSAFGLQQPGPDHDHVDRANTDGYSWDNRGDDRLPGLRLRIHVADPGNWAFGTFPAVLPKFASVRRASTTLPGRQDRSAVRGDGRSGSSSSVSTTRKYDFVSFESRRAL
jgi:hypothetical protein